MTVAQRDIKRAKFLQISANFKAFGIHGQFRPVTKILSLLSLTPHVHNCFVYAGNIWKHDIKALVPAHMEFCMIININNYT